MNETNEPNFEQSSAQAAAFQKIWMDSMSKLVQAAFTFNPNGPPPEILKQMRSGIFQALGQSWEEFMRSPQFIDGMKQWMENAIAFRKMSTDFMANMRNEMQAPSRDDIGNVLLAVRHLEKRLLDRIDSIELQLKKSNGRPANGHARKATAQAPSSQRKQPKNVKTIVPGGNPTTP